MDKSTQYSYTHRTYSQPAKHHRARIGMRREMRMLCRQPGKDEDAVWGKKRGKKLKQGEITQNGQHFT